MSFSVQEAGWWRDKYFALQKELQLKEKQWAAEDKETAVAEAVMAKELEMKSALLVETQSKLEELQGLQASWGAVVGRRDAREDALRAKLAEHEAQARKAAEERQAFWDRKRKQREEWAQRWQEERAWREEKRTKEEDGHE